MSPGEQQEEGLLSWTAGQQPGLSCALQDSWPPCPPFPVPSCQQGGQGSYSGIVTFSLHCHPCCQCLLLEWGQPMECGRMRASMRGDTSPAKPRGALATLEGAARRILLQKSPRNLQTSQKWTSCASQWETHGLAPQLPSSHPTFPVEAEVSRPGHGSDMEHMRHHLIPLLVPGITSHLCCHQLPPPCQRRRLHDPSSSRDTCQPGCSTMAGTSMVPRRVRVSPQQPGRSRVCHAQLSVLGNAFWFLVKEGAMMWIPAKKSAGRA